MYMTEKQQRLVQLRRSFEHKVKMDDKAWSAAEDHFELTHFSRKQMFFSAGDISDNVNFLLEGIGRYFYSDEQGKERNKSFAKPPGAVTILPSLINGSPSPFSAQALTDCTCITIRYADLKALNKKNLCWSQLSLVLFEELALRKDVRIAQLLMCSAPERYQLFLEEFGPLVELIPNYQIASYLGITEVALSRIRRKMNLT